MSGVTVFGGPHRPSRTAADHAACRTEQRRDQHDCADGRQRNDLHEEHDDEHGYTDHQGAFR